MICYLIAKYPILGIWQLYESVFNMTIEKNPVIKNNILYFALFSIISNIVLLFSSGALIQSFLLSFGLSEIKVGVITSLYSVTQVMTMVLCSLFSDKIRSIKKVVSYSALPQIVFYIAMSIFCVINNVNSVVVYIVAFISVFIQGMALGICNIFIYKLPYLIINMDDYGKISSSIGLIAGVLGVGISAIVKILINSFSYYYVMFGCFSLSVVLLLLQFIFALKIKEVFSHEDSHEKIHFYDVFKHKSFLILSLPNIFRGICLGMTQMIPVFAVKQFNADSNMTASIVVILNIASFLGSFAFLFTEKRMRLNILCFISNMLFVVPLAAMSLVDNWMLYLSFYFIANIGLYTFSTAVPVYVTKIVPFEIMGAYTSWRMLFTTGGTALGAFICGALIDKVSVPVIMLGVLLLQFICGAVYGLYPIFDKAK